MTHDNWRDLAIDLKLTNNELAERFSKLKTEYYEIKRANYDLRMRLVFAKDALRNADVTEQPRFVDDDEYECGKCYMKLKREWDFCPSCGKWLDWDFTIYPDDNDGAYDAFRDAQYCAGDA